MRRKGSLSLLVAVMLVLTVSLVLASATLAQERWIMASSREGTFGYATATEMAWMVEKYAKGVKLTVLQGYSTTATHTVYGKGEASCAYISLLSLKDALPFYILL